MTKKMIGKPLEMLCLIPEHCNKVSTAGKKKQCRRGEAEF